MHTRKMTQRVPLKDAQCGQGATQTERTLEPGRCEGQECAIISRNAEAHSGEAVSDPGGSERPHVLRETRASM